LRRKRRLAIPGKENTARPAGEDTNVRRRRQIDQTRPDQHNTTQQTTDGKTNTDRQKYVNTERQESRQHRQIDRPTEETDQTRHTARKL
jgi:hypothetical protein